MLQGIEFTDRYGGRTPSALTACFTCEAMGSYPEWRGPRPIAIDGPDHWEFVTCPDCKGTAKVPWPQTVKRLPGWLWKGVPFTFIHAPQASNHLPYWRGALLGFKCAYLVDLGLWRP